MCSQLSLELVNYTRVLAADSLVLVNTLVETCRRGINLNTDASVIYTGMLFPPNRRHFEVMQPRSGTITMLKIICAFSITFHVASSHKETTSIASRFKTRAFTGRTYRG